MKRFDDYMKHFSEVDGWFQTQAIAIWDTLLSALNRNYGDVFFRLPRRPLEVVAFPGERKDHFA